MVDRTRVPRLVLAAEGLGLGLLGGTGLLLTGGAGGTRVTADVLGLGMSTGHALVLLGTGAAAVLGATGRRAAAWWAGAQFALGTALFAYGVGEHPAGARAGPLGITAGGHVLHLAVAATAVVVGMLLAGPALGPEQRRGTEGDESAARQRSAPGEPGGPGRDTGPGTGRSAP